jgi:hypothetical protein
MQSNFPICTAYQAVADAQFKTRAIDGDAVALCRSVIARYIGPTDSRDTPWRRRGTRNETDCFGFYYSHHSVRCADLKLRTCRYHPGAVDSQPKQVRREASSRDWISAARI